MNQKVATGARLLLGLMFTVFGLNGFLNFMPAPPQPANVATFMNGMMAAPYFLPFLKGCEVLCGVMLLLNWQVPLALVILAPICLQIFLFHAFMTPGLGNLILPAVIIVLGLLVARAHQKQFRPLFQKNSNSL